MDRRDLGSWLQGPAALPGSDSPYPGARLGRPESGSGSIASIGRRLGALVIDWLLCLLIVHGFLGAHALKGAGTFLPLLVLVVENVLLVGTAGATIGHALFGLRVETLSGVRPGLGPVLIRAVLLGIPIFPLTAPWQEDLRGLHELASGTLVARR